jgi:hypothetical protein
MKHYLPHQIICLTFFVAFAIPVTQAQNIKNEKVDVKYLQPPLSPLPPEIKTFKRTIDLRALSMTDSREKITQDVRNYFKLYGDRFQETQSNADLELTARLDQYLTENSQVVTEQRSEKKSDKTTVNYNVYFGKTNIAYPLWVQIRNTKKDLVIFEGFINKSDQYEAYSTSTFRDPKAAREALDKILTDKRHHLRISHLSALNGLMISTWSDYPAEMRWSINYVETSKKANYDDVMSARDATMSAMASLTNKSSELSAESKQLLTTAIDKWTIILKESDPENRKARVDRKVTQAIVENLAFCNFFLHNFTEAERYLKDGKERNKQQWQFDLEASIADMKKRFEANKITYQ